LDSRHARSEIIEIGTGLTSFASDFTGMRADEFRDPVRELLRQGGTLKCFALGSGCEPGLASKAKTATHWRWKTRAA
jgi:hypothetical protein